MPHSASLPRAYDQRMCSAQKSLLRHTFAGAVLLLAACGGETVPAESRTSERLGAAPVQRGDAGFSVSFSGRVPRLKGPPPDTVRVSRFLARGEEFGDISQVFLVDRYLLAMDPYVDPHLAVIDRKTGMLTARVGRHGRGPGELQAPRWAFVSSRAPLEAKVYDFQNRALTTVRVEESGKATIRHDRSLNVGAALESPTVIGSTVVSNGLFPDHTLLVAGLDGKPLAQIVADPPFDERAMPHVVGRRQLNRNFLATDPGRTRIVLAYQWRPRIDFFTAEGVRYGSVTGPRETKPSFRLEGSRFFWNPDNVMAYVRATATDAAVYALFCGCSLESNGLPRTVHVFRWNGDFVGEFVLDREVRSIAVSEDGSELYGSFVDPEPGLGVWKIPAKFHPAPTSDGEPAP